MFMARQLFAWTMFSFEERGNKHKVTNYRLKIWGLNPDHRDREYTPYERWGKCPVLCLIMFSTIMTSLILEGLVCQNIETMALLGLDSCYQEREGGVFGKIST